MPGIIIGVIILAYTIFVIYKRVKDLKAGKSCCGGNCSSCSGCSSKEKCGVK